MKRMISNQGLLIVICGLAVAAWVFVVLVVQSQARPGDCTAAAPRPNAPQVSSSRDSLLSSQEASLSPPKKINDGFGDHVASASEGSMAGAVPVSPAVSAMNRQLFEAPPPESVQSMCEFLQRQDPPRGMSPQRFYARKNGLMNQLSRMNPPVPGFTDVLIGLYKDKTTDLVTRDYAIQAMSLTWYAKASTQDKVRIQALLVSALSETDSSLSGTALLAMYRLSRWHGAFDEQIVKASAKRIAEDGNAGVLARATALRLCGYLGVVEILPSARTLSGQSRDYSLALAAEAAVRDLTQGSSIAARKPCFNCN